MRDQTQVQRWLERKASEKFRLVKTLAKTRHFFYLELSTLLVTVVSFLVVFSTIIDPWDLELQEFLGTLYYVFRLTSIFLAVCAILARKGRTWIGWLCLATVFVEGYFLIRSLWL